MGPGSLFTSLIPNLLVRGVAQAIVASRAVKVFICNLMTEANESLHMSAADHIQAIYAHSGHKIFDYALVNSAPVSPRMKEQYAVEHADQVECDASKVEEMGVKCITGDFVEEDHFARHATDRLSRKLLELGQIDRDRSRSKAVR
jgi:uncharacterized cofD-like protein